MTERMTKEKDAGYLEFVLTSAAVAVKGEVACLDTSTGIVTVGGTSTTLIPIGYFTESLTGDGTTKTSIKLFQELRLHWLDNDDSPNDVQTSDVGNEVYLKDGKTVSTLSTGRSIAGRVFAISTLDGVLVQAGAAVMGPTGGGVAGGAVASRAALKGVGATSRYDGQLVLVKTDGSMWRFVAASIVEADGADELAIAPTSGTGMWLRADKSFVMKLPIDHTMSDGQEICEIPAGMAVKLAAEPFWEVTTGWTGGSSASIGIASSQTGYNTAGDLLGGAAGELTAVLGTTGVKPGTIGPHVDTLVERQALVMVSGDTITYEKIADTYGAGAGFVCIPVLVATVAGG